MLRFVGDLSALRQWLSLGIAMAEAARQQGLVTPYRFEIIPGAGHDFRQCMERGMGSLVADFIEQHRPPSLPEIALLAAST